MPTEPARNLSLASVVSILICSIDIGIDIDLEIYIYIDIHRCIELLFS